MVKPLKLHHNNSVILLLMKQIAIYGKGIASNPPVKHLHLLNKIVNVWGVCLQVCPFVQPSLLTKLIIIIIHSVVMVKQNELLYSVLAVIFCVGRYAVLKLVLLTICMIIYCMVCSCVVVLCIVYLYWCVSQYVTVCILWNGKWPWPNSIVKTDKSIIKSVYTG